MARRPKGHGAALSRRRHFAFVPKLVAIQVLRGLAALAIALLHLEPEWRQRGFVPEGWTRPFPLEAGVDVFFVISGFVMVYASHALFGRPGAARLFLVRRIARVVPLYWLTTAFVLVLLVVKPELMRSALATPGLVVASFLFVPWPRPDGVVQPVYTLGWTLNYEMFFYLVFSAALAFGLARRAAVAAIACLLVGLVALGLARPSLPQPLGFWTSPMQVEFVLGMLLGLARIEGTTLPPAARLVLAALGTGLFWWIGGDAVLRTGRDNALLFALPAACLVAACGLAAGRPEGLARDRMPARWPARLGESLGDASYAIYLLHPFAIRSTVRAIEGLGLAPALGPIGITAAALAATIALALLSHRLVERPLTRLARRLTAEERGRETAREGGGARTSDPG